MPPGRCTVAPAISGCTSVYSGCAGHSTSSPIDPSTYQAAMEPEAEAEAQPMEADKLLEKAAEKVAEKQKKKLRIPVERPRQRLQRMQE